MGDENGSKTSIGKGSRISLGLIIAGAAVFATVGMAVIFDRLSIQSSLVTATDAATKAIETANDAKKTAQSAQEAIKEAEKERRAEYRQIVDLMGAVRQTLGRLEGQLQAQSKERQ